jgi:pimeloyl-ACP methyl ester carboxylesterase
MTTTNPRVSDDDEQYEPWMQPARHGFTGGVVLTSRSEVRYWHSGHGDQTLVMLHGGGGVEIGLPHELLARDHRVIVLEVPGFGPSAPEDDLENSEQVAHLMAEVAEALGLAQYAVAGTSMGGVAAAWWAACYPDRVTSLILECPALFRLREPDVAVLSDIDAFRRAFHAQPDRKPWCQTDIMPQPPDPGLMIRLMGPAFDDGLIKRLTDFHTPVLLLWGTKDGVLPKEHAREVLRFIPHAHSIYVFDAAHDLKGDRPEAFANIVSEFLTYGDRFVIRHKSTVVNP